MCDSKWLRDRCFFLHLGVALNVHPFALQAALRYYAQRAIDRLSEEGNSCSFSECRLDLCCLAVLFLDFFTVICDTLFDKIYEVWAVYSW